MTQNDVTGAQHLQSLVPQCCLLKGSAVTGQPWRLEQTAKIKQAVNPNNTFLNHPVANIPQF
jgi:hypothetical protein